MHLKSCFLAILIIFILSPKAEAVKIGLQTGGKEIKVASSVSAEIYDGLKDKLLYEIRPMTIYTFKTKGNELSVSIDRKNINLGTNQVIIKTKTPGFLCSKKSWYRGDFIINNMGSSATLINDVPLEDYLKGVVPSEMPSKWNTEALKAQAIAARSYAVATTAAGKHASQGFDLVDTTADQAYGGASVEKAATTKAVEDTKGIVLVQNKKVLPTYYHASSGGQTKVWDSGSSFLQSVPSFDAGTKKNGHGVGMSQHGANNLAAQGYNAYQILNYFYKDFKFAKLSENWDI
ncbi:MAG: SpoIID/LytB domain-containing protein [Candidatus Gastranaerophilales bacterium]|nr:SpoIID/LytB domain-containing protein [Candidatus Gastranaerophilales bacterium]